MGMPDVAKRWTREEVLALPDDGNRYELIDGELLVGSTMLAPADLDLKSGQLVQPDLFVAPLVDGREVLDWAAVGIPLLIAEVLSPSTARYDRFTKRGHFQRAGVPDYRIVDLDARLVEHWRPGDARPEILSHELVWHPNPAVPPLVIDVPTYFREVWAED